jgi:hypothetical protein
MHRGGVLPRIIGNNCLFVYIALIRVKCQMLFLIHIPLVVWHGIMTTRWRFSLLSWFVWLLHLVIWSAGTIEWSSEWLAPMGMSVFYSTLIICHVHVAFVISVASYIIKKFTHTHAHTLSQRAHTCAHNLLQYRKHSRLYHALAAVLSDIWMSGKKYV